MRFIEVCATSLFDVEQAVEGGASRVELCSALELGGITPSYGLIKQVLERCRIKTNILIRARGGDFVYTKEEIDTMIEDIRMCKRLGVNGVVIGALTSDGDIDIEAVRRMVDAAKPELEVTFHRAFDRAGNPHEALEQIISLGCDTLLTSGQQEESAEYGVKLLAELVKQSNSRITIMPGKGVRTSNIDYIEKISGATQFHSTARSAKYSNIHTDKEIVAQMSHKSLK